MDDITGDTKLMKSFAAYKGREKDQKSVLKGSIWYSDAGIIIIAHDVKDSLWKRQIARKK